MNGFASLGDFLAMGGHGFYVWMAITSCALVVAVELLMLRAARLQLKAAMDLEAQDTGGSEAAQRPGRHAPAWPAVGGLP